MSRQEGNGAVVNAAATSGICIGGSEAAAAVGLDPYCSRVELWARKTGRLAPPEGNEAMLWGTLLEPVIREQVAKQGYQINPDLSNQLSEEYLWMTGHVDGFAVRDGRGDQAVYEGKTAGQWTGNLWNDEGAPPAYVIQIHHYLVLTGLSWGLLACLVAGQRLEIREIERDDKLCDLIVNLEGEFVDYCEKDTPPPPDGSDATTEVLKRLYPTTTGEIIALTADDARTVEALRETKREAKQIAEEQAKLENELKLRLGDAAIGTYEGTKLISWPEITAQVKATEAHERRYRRFQVYGS